MPIPVHSSALMFFNRVSNVCRFQPVPPSKPCQRPEQAVDRASNAGRAPAVLALSYSRFTRKSGGSSHYNKHAFCPNKKHAFSIALFFFNRLLSRIPFVDVGAITRHARRGRLLHCNTGRCHSHRIVALHRSGCRMCELNSHHILPCTNKHAFSLTVPNVQRTISMLFHSDKKHAFFVQVRDGRHAGGAVAAHVRRASGSSGNEPPVGSIPVTARLSLAGK